ncbi:MAG: hypothetical protein WC955_05865 [Elusimicrobiota bacterium]
MKQNIKVFVLPAIIIVFVLITTFFPVYHPKVEVLSPPDMRYGLTENDISAMFGVKYSFVRYIFEPVLGPVEYVSQWRKINIQLFTLFFWVLAVSVVIGIIKSKKNSIFIICITALYFFVFIAFCVLFPSSANRIVINSAKLKLVDIHSHTFQSHDGIRSFEYNNRWHKNMGFNEWYITEHEENNHTGNMELNLESNHYLFLQMGQLSVKDEEKFWLSNVPGKISMAHEHGGTVIVAEQWNDKNGKSPDILAGYGVDGFEIVNGGFPYITKAEQQEIIDTCRKYKLTLWSSTDWHGWGNSYAYATAVDTPIPIGTKFTRVLPLCITRNESYSFTRLSLEPASSIFYYFSGLNISQRISWILWTLFFSVIFNLRVIKTCRKKFFVIFLNITLVVFLLFNSTVFAQAFLTEEMGGNKVIPLVFFMVTILAVILGVYTLSLNKQEKSSYGLK